MTIISIELSVHYDYLGESVVVKDNTFVGTPGSIEFIGNEQSKIEINNVDDVIEILQDFKKKFNFIKKMEVK